MVRLHGWQLWLFPPAALLDGGRGGGRGALWFLVRHEVDAAGSALNALCSLVHVPLGRTKKVQQFKPILGKKSPINEARHNNFTTDFFS